jgi:nucleotide-binding universal stress UspA family protein
VFNNIVVALDGSTYSERALDAARELARLSGARLHLLTVVLAYKQAHVPVVGRLDQQTEQRANDYLRPLAATATGAGAAVVTYVRHGAPAEEIVRLATEVNADLITMSTHGIGATGLHALGSVAMKVLETAPCPVMMIRVKVSAA